MNTDEPERGADSGQRPKRKKSALETAVWRFLRLVLICYIAVGLHCLPGMSIRCFLILRSIGQTYSNRTSQH